MPKCEVCDLNYVDHPLESPLHSTNWNFGNRRTLNVCSVECKEWAEEEDRQRIRKNMLKNAARDKEKIELAVSILNAFEKDYQGNVLEPRTHEEASTVLYRINRLLDKNDCWDDYD